MALQNVDAALWPTNFSPTTTRLLAENSYLLLILIHLIKKAILLQPKDCTVRRAI